MFNKYADLYLEMTNKKKKDFVPINEKYTVKVDRDDAKNEFKLKETVDIVFYEMDKNILTNPKKITIKTNKIFKDTLRDSLKSFLEKKIGPTANFNYLQIFQNNVDHYGLLKIDDHNKIFEKIVHTLAVGIPIYKNF